MKRRIRLVVAYDGTAYCGWQLQKNGVTIEEVLNRELSALLKEPIAVIGASRTDAGVHALGNVAVFDTENRMAADKICLAVNQSLPEDIRVQSSEEVPLTWHPRKANCVKTYEYRILNRRIALPTERLYAYFCYYNLDVERMREAASCLVGEHDFRSFCSSGSCVEDMVRTIYRLDVHREGDCVRIRVSGSGFLYNMVRIIAGTLMQVGTGLIPPERMAEILAARDRRLAGPTAPARGLTLVSVDYEKELPPWLRGANEDWEYAVLQSHIKEEQTAFLTVRRCRDEEWDRLVLRQVHHAFQNGARRVFLTDWEKDRLRVGGRYGYYVIRALAGTEGEEIRRMLTEEELRRTRMGEAGELSGRFGAADREVCRRPGDGLDLSGWFCAVDGGKTGETVPKEGPENS